MLRDKTVMPQNPPIPEALYPCANRECAEVVTYPPDMLFWCPELGGFYCEDCIDQEQFPDEPNGGITQGCSLKQYFEYHCHPNRETREHDRLQAFLEGLEMKDVQYLLDHASADDFRHLGRAMAIRIKRVTSRPESILSYSEELKKPGYESLEF